MYTKPCICIADDEPEILSCLELLIEDLGIDVTVHTAVDGEEALEFIKEKHIHLLITDLNMPKLEGNDLIGEIFSSADISRPDFIFVISGHIRVPIGHESIDNVSFFSKPMDLEAFGEKIIEAIKSIDSRIKGNGDV